MGASWLCRRLLVQHLRKLCGLTPGFERFSPVLARSAQLNPPILPPSPNPSISGNRAAGRCPWVLTPAVQLGVIDEDAALGHHLLDVSNAQRVGHVPAPRTPASLPAGSASAEPLGAALQASLYGQHHLLTLPVALIATEPSDPPLQDPDGCIDAFDAARHQRVPHPCQQVGDAVVEILYRQPLFAVGRAQTGEAASVDQCV